MTHDLKPEQQAELVNAQLDQLRAERFQHQLNVTRWDAIPDDLKDGTETAAIDQSKHAIGVLEAQIDALTAMLPAPNRAQRRAK